MPEVLVIGQNGQLGHELLTQLRTQNITALGITREQLDVTQPAAIAELFSSHPNVRTVFNATAYNAVDTAETHPDDAFRTNTLAPAALAAACRQHGARFVHFSTDYVFGDGYSDPIDESQPANPCSVYGRSKRQGEILALQNNPDTFVLRTCGLYSERRHNFIRTMLRHALKGAPLKVVNDQLVTPTWVRPLARSAIALAQQPVAGIFHASAHGQCTWFEYAQYIFNTLEISADLTPVSQTTWAAAARRPTYSVLDNRLLRLLDIDFFNDWHHDLDEFLGMYGQRIIEEEA